MKLSNRVIEAATTDIYHNFSQQENGNATQQKQNGEILEHKPQIDTNIKIDKKRSELPKSNYLGLNALNLMQRTKDLQ